VPDIKICPVEHCGSEGTVGVVFVLGLAVGHALACGPVASPLATALQNCWNTSALYRAH